MNNSKKKPEKCVNEIYAEYIEMVNPNPNILLVGTHSLKPTIVNSKTAFAKTVKGSSLSMGNFNIIYVKGAWSSLEISSRKKWLDSLYKALASDGIVILQETLINSPYVDIFTYPKTLDFALKLATAYEAGKHQPKDILESFINEINEVNDKPNISIISESDIIKIQEISQQVAMLHYSNLKLGSIYENKMMLKIDSLLKYLFSQGYLCAITKDNNEHQKRLSRKILEYFAKAKLSIKENSFFNGDGLFVFEKE